MNEGWVERRLDGEPSEKSARRRPRRLSGGAAQLALALPLVMIAGKCPAEAVLIDSDCIQAKAVGVRKSGGGVSVRGVSVETGGTSSSGEDCPALTGAELVLYDESGETPGYQQGEDTFVALQSGQLDVASGKLKIGSFSNQGSGATASSWTATVTTTKGTSVFVGTF